MTNKKREGDPMKCLMIGGNDPDGQMTFHDLTELLTPAERDALEVQRIQNKMFSDESSVPGPPLGGDRAGSPPTE